MAFTTYTILADGITDIYPVNFPLGYLNKSDVQVQVNNEVDGLGDPVYRSVSWITDGLIQIGGTFPSAGQPLKFNRTVSKTTLAHDYTNGAAIEEKNLDDSNKQTLMAVQELLDGRFDSGLAQNLNMNGFRIIDMADAVDPQDAVTLSQMEDMTGNAPFYADQAAASAITAQAAATSAQSADHLKGTSSTSLVIGTGTKTLTASTNKVWLNNQVVIASTVSPTNYMHGMVTAYNPTTGAMTVEVEDVGGSGTLSSWTISVSGTRGPQGATGAPGSPGAGTGDVVGPASVTNGRIAVWNGTSGDVLGQAAGVYGTMASQNSNGVNITAGTIQGCDVLYSNVNHCNLQDAHVLTFQDATALNTFKTYAGIGTITPWVAYTPTFSAFGTVSGVSVFSRRVGDTLQIRGKFTAGSSTGSEARMTLGYNGVNNTGVGGDVVPANAKIPTGTSCVGYATQTQNSYGINVLIEPSVNYVTWGNNVLGPGGLNKAAADNVAGSGIVTSFFAEIPIQGW